VHVEPPRPRMLSLRAGKEGTTESHFLPSKEDASMTDSVQLLCGSKDSRSESLVARKASWHRSPCERTVWLPVSMSLCVSMLEQWQCSQHCMRTMRRRTYESAEV
jgi:hypothetical protein